MQNGIAKNINRYCELVDEINSLNKNLKKERDDFYDGGHSFEDCYKSDLENLDILQNEFLSIFAILHSQITPIH